MSKYILIRVDDKAFNFGAVLKEVKRLLDLHFTVKDCTGEDLYYGFENCAENLGNVTMLAVEDEPEDE